MTQPKTQAELQARVLEVLRREWPDSHLDADLDFRLVHRNALCCQGYLGANGLAFGLAQELNTCGLEALAEASRLLRDGVAAPSRVDRALEVLRAEFPSAHVDRRPYAKGTEPPAEREAAALAAVRGVFQKAHWGGGELRLVYDAISYHPEIDMWALWPSTVAAWTPEALRAVLHALDILNGVGEQ